MKKHYKLKQTVRTTDSILRIYYDVILKAVYLWERALDRDSNIIEL